VELWVPVSSDTVTVVLGTLVVEGVDMRATLGEGAEWPGVVSGGTVDVLRCLTSWPADADGRFGFDESGVRSNAAPSIIAMTPRPTHLPMTRGRASGRGRDGRVELPAKQNVGLTGDVDR
jgi:hypothetical protein